MLWYGLSFLFVLLTMMSMIIDGSRGFGSTRTTIKISTNLGYIPVGSSDGFSRDGGLIYIGNEKIRYNSITENFGTTGLPAFDVRGGRGYDGTQAEAHNAGVAVYSEITEALNEGVSFQIAEVDSIWGAIQYPFQAVGLFGKFIARVITWDYQYLRDGYAVYIKFLFLYPLNIMVGFALLNVFKDALSIIGLRR